MGLIVGITGSGDTTLNNAAALLDDYLPVDDVTVYVPSYITSDGMRVVVQWLKDANINIERVKKNEIREYILDDFGASEDRVLIVLGTEGSEEIIKECLKKQVPVLDLTRGLYQVTESEMPLDGSESEPETQTDDDPSPVPPSEDPGSPSLTGIQWDRSYYHEINELRKEVNVLREHAGLPEINWEHTADPRMPVRPADTETLAQEERGETQEGTMYFQNGKGKVRKAGRSKIKPGEKIVFLKEEDVEKSG